MSIERFSHENSRVKKQDSEFLDPGAWLVVLLLWFVGVFNYFDRQLITTMGEPVMKTFQVDTQSFGLVFSLYLWVYAFFSPLAGYLADRFGHARTLAWSLLAWSAVTMGFGAATSFEMLLLFRVLLAIFQSFAIPAGAALIAAYYPSSRRAFALAIFFSGSMVGTLLCSTGGLISEWMHWRTGFLVAGAAGIVCAAFLFFRLRDPEKPKEDDNPVSAAPPEGSWRNLVCSPLFLLLFLTNGIVGFGAWILASWLPYYFFAEQNLSLTSAALHGVLTINFATLCGMFVFSRLSDRLSRRSLCFRAFVPAVAMLLSSPFLFGIGWNDSFFYFFFSLLIIGFAEGAVDPNLMPILCGVSRPENRALGYGMLNFAATFSGGIAIYLGGWFKNRDIPLALSFQIAAVSFFLAGILFFLCGMRLRINRMSP